MNVLILGGTGAMGVPLMNILLERGDQVDVTSRRERTSSNRNLKYLQGNTMEDAFLAQILSTHYDAIVDFMHYRPTQFEGRMKMLLEATERYVFLSSSRVYAPTKEPIREDSPRLLEAAQDADYLATEEYALSKARVEDLLRRSGRRNYTIVRPYITYNTERLQLSIFEKEAWLYRALRGRSVVFSKDLAARRTSLTYGGDVARAMADMLQNPGAAGEAVHIVCGDSMTWGEILDLYVETIEAATGKKVSVHMEENAERLAQIVGNTYKLRYDRLSDRVFDSGKADVLALAPIRYTPMREGLKAALQAFLEEEKPQFRYINWNLQAYLDRLSGERTPLAEIPTAKSKLKYLICHDTPYLKWKMRKAQITWW